jgi:oligopeptide transport system substrate-binding protein
MKKNTIREISRKAALIFISLFLLLAILPGCLTGDPVIVEEVAGNQESEKPEAGPPEEEYTPTGDDENIFVMSVDPPRINLNPLYTFTSTEAQLYTALYEGLVTYHPFTLEPVPAVAEFWELIEDRRVYRFLIREEARYWNGDKVEAEHFRASWLKLIDPETAGEYGSLIDVIKGARDYRLGINTDPESVAIRVPEPGILEVELERPAPHFLKVLCHHSFSPVHPKMLELDDWTDLNTVLGNGPFTLTSSSDQEMVLTKNQLYWDAGSVKLNGIRILYRDDPEWASGAIDNGTLQWAESSVDFETLKNKNAMVLNPAFSTTYFFFSKSGETQSSYNQPKVRKALALLVPWDQVRNTEFMYLPTSSLVPRIEGYPEVTGIENSDRNLALSLLEEAGFPGGEGLPPVRFLLPEGEEANRIADLMAESWHRELGVTIEIETAGFQDYYDRLKSEKFTLGVLTWIGDFADPLTFLQMWTSDAALNIGNYNNQEFDRIISESTGMEDYRSRYEAMAEAEELLLEEAMVLPIKHSPAFNIIDLERINGWFPNPLDIHPFKYLEFQPYYLPDGVA